MMKRIVTILILLVGISSSLSAQRKIQELDEEEAEKQENLKKYESKKKGFDPDKLSFGGNAGAAFSNGGGFILLQPMVGYSILPKTMVGLGGTYIYQTYNYMGVKYSSNTYGPILFARQQLLPSIFAHAEYSPINYARYNPLKGEEERYWMNQMFLGGGLGGGRGAYVFVLYDVMWNENSIYNSPWMIRMGFMF